MQINNEIENIRRQLEESKNTSVSVALFGQPGAGKSSLINKLVGKKVAEVGVETDKTVEALHYESNGLKFVDLPGYGTKQFPKESYFAQFDIPAFDLFLCVTSGKLHQSDTEFFQDLKKLGKVCIFVVNKHDELWEDGVDITDLEERKRCDISKHLGQQAKVIFTSCRVNTGIDELSREIQANLEGAKRERWARGAKAYSEKFLEEKRAACEKYVALAAAAAAANGLNPVPGLDIAVDLSVMMKLFDEIRDDYGLSANVLHSLKLSAMPVVGRLANNVVQYAAKEGLLLLLKSYAGREVLKSVSKYIPFVGQAIAAGLGYAITASVGSRYLNDCHELATQLLDQNL